MKEHKKIDDPSKSKSIKLSNTAPTVTDHSKLHQQYIQAATSENTRRSYQSAIKHFLESGFLLPATVQMVTDYLLIYSEKLNARTLDVRLTAISQWHTLQKFYDPTRDPSIKKLMTGIRRTHGQPKKKAKPIQIDELQRMLQYLGSNNSLINLRNSALLLTGFFGAFRCSELTSIEIGDLHWESEGLIITIKKSKTDQDNLGMKRVLPKSMNEICPCKILKRWIEAANLTEGALFRHIDRWGNISTTQMNSNMITRIIRKIAEKSLIKDPHQFSSHSFRRGLSTEASKAGVAFNKIKQQGGWKNDSTVWGYIEEGEQFKDNAGSPLLKKLNNQ